MLCSRSHELVFSVLKLTDAVSPLSIASAIGSSNDSSVKETVTILIEFLISGFNRSYDIMIMIVPEVGTILKDSSDSK